VDVEPVSVARIARRYHEGLAFSRKTDVANKSLIENSVNSFAIKMAALWQAL